MPNRSNLQRPLEFCECLLKKPPLTPEEKKALKAEKKAEKKRLLIEKKKQLKRDVLGRELKYGDITIKRHAKDWRQMLIKIALPKMKEDLEFAWHNFERVIDCKNFIISLLKDEIRDAEEQYMMNVRNHIEHVEKLIDMFHVRLEELQQDNDTQLMKLQHKSEEEAEEIKLTAGEEETYLKTMVYMLEVARKEQKQNVRADYYSKLEEEETKYNQIVQRLRAILEKELQNVWKNTMRFLDTYNSQIKERKKEHNELKTQDDSLQILLCTQIEKIRKVLDYLKTLKQKYNDSQKLLGKKKDFDQIVILTVNYNGTIEHLEKLKEKGEHILHVAAVCRKLETQEEKITPFPLCPIKDLTNMDETKEYVESLDLFWQRVAQVDASRYAINEEREFLKTENEILKMKLHQYCQCVSCPSTGNSLKRSGKYITEGVFEQQKYDKQNVNQFTSQAYDAEIDE
ncbi:hypothetical protein NQ314_011327 [Rhamnusium bicolor]|uniref:Dynein regulatory complex subunit 2 n=1 Tax=Rhamnusium bicolor TaxID=1586634 RepID=A0AAV8XJW1_9CUCU|nr:hypothetical protein NQ314_011327 [Rhamnusium bicolor]